MMTDLEPDIRYACVVHAVESIAEVLGHDNRSVDGQLEVDQCRPDRYQHPLHPVDLLPQEDVQRLGRSDLLQAILHLV